MQLIVYIKSYIFIWRLKFKKPNHYEYKNRR